MGPERPGLGGYSEQRRKIADDASARNRQVQRGECQFDFALLVPGGSPGEEQQLRGECGCLLTRPCLFERQQQAAVRRQSGRTGLSDSDALQTIAPAGGVILRKFLWLLRIAYLAWTSVFPSPLAKRSL
ncbi:MAG TPA: hypothetical protein VE398_12350 [Acidobacteriota bacterium]|nr:hypothetical protein [Acidobacteriota bacterium]